MAIVKSIDVALRANTEQFEAGLKSGAQSVDAFANSAKKVMEKMDKAWHLFNKGAIEVDEYSKRIQQGEDDLRALGAGFNGMAAATQRAQQVLLGMETETDRYTKKIKELDALLSLERLTQEQHTAAVRQATEAYQALQEKMRGPSDKDVAAQSVGFKSMSDAVARADSVLSGMQTRTDQYRQSIKELNQLASIGALDQDQLAQALQRTKSAFASLFPKASAADLKAQAAGFSSMSEAMSRAESVLGGLKTKTEAYRDRLKELQRLRQVDALTQDQFTESVKRTKAAFASMFPKASADDLKARAAGFESMSAAMAESNAVLKSLETSTERYQAKLNRLGQLFKAGALTQDQYTEAVKRTANAHNAAIRSSGSMHDATSRLGLEYAGTLPIVGQFTHLVGASLTPIGGLAAALVGAAAATKLFHTAFSTASEMVKSGLERLDAAADAAERVGLLTDQFQRLSFAARMSDVSTDALTTSLLKMSRNISEAISGNTSAAKSFQQLGVDVRALSRMSPDQAFRTLADAVSRVESPFDQLRLTMEVFGKSGSELILMLRDGAKALDEAGAKADSFRLTDTREDASQIKEATDAIKELTSAYEGLENVLARRAAPILTEVLKDATNAIAKPQESVALTGVVGMAADIQKSNNAWEAAYRLSQRYFDGVSQRAAEASNAISQAAKPIQETADKLKNAFTPEDIEAYSSIVEEAGKRQQQIAKQAADAQRSLRADSMAASVGTGAPGLPALPAVPTLPPLKLGVNVDPQPLKTFEMTVAALQQRLASGSITKVDFFAGLNVANNNLQKSLGLLEEFHQQQASIAKATMDAEKSLHAKRMAALADLRREKHDAWAKENPALAAQEEMRKRVAAIEDLYRSGNILLKERNELLAFVPKTVKAPGMDDAAKAMEDMKKRSAEIAESVKTPFEKYAEKVAEIKKLERMGVARGGIDKITAARAEMDARMEAVNAAGAEQIERIAKLRTLDGPDALDRNSQAAFSSFQQNRRNQIASDELEKLNQKILEELKSIRRGPVVLARARL